MMDAFWEFTAIVVVMAAIVIAAVPKRWLWRTIAIWFVSPVPVYFGVIFWEASTRPMAINVLGNAMMGFALISAFALIPWVIIASIATAFGALMRGMFRGRTAKPSDKQGAS